MDKKEKEPQKAVSEAGMSARKKYISNNVKQLNISFQRIMMSLKPASRDTSVLKELHFEHFKCSLQPFVAEMQHL